MKFLMSILSMTCLLLICCEPVRSEAIHRPNVIIILTDDQGYQDLGCFGSPKIKTPCIDRMAEEGIRLTDFYVGASVCSASRASLLTGRMPARHGVGTAFFPGDGSMPTNEATIAELLKEAGYRTACFGKWHLGDENESVLPTGQGFDEYFGIPYSNDMYINPNHAFAVDTLFAFDYDKTKALADQDSVRELKRTKKKFDDYLKQGVAKKVPLFEGVKIVEYPADQATLTLRYFDRAIDFVEKSQDQPFFIYLTPAMPHVPLFASEDFAGKSERGLYGDVIEEIDFHTGRLLDHLRHSNRRNRTIVIFTSDNGPWLRKGNRSGCAIPLRDGKFTTYEGGVRMPCVMWWPGNWRPGSVSDQVISAMDLMPTIAHYAGARMPKVPLDGFNIANHLETPQTPVKRKYLYYTKGRKLSGVRRGDWKYLRHGGSMHQSSKNGPELYNLRDDVGERNNVAKSNPELIEQLEQELRRFEMTMTD